MTEALGDLSTESLPGAPAVGVTLRPPATGPLPSLLLRSP